MPSKSFFREIDATDCSVSHTDSFWIVDLGLIDYDEGVELQKKISESVKAEPAQGVLLLLEHPPTVTLGTRGSWNDVIVSKEMLARHGIKVCRVNRGGSATFHGPGQLIAYPVVHLRWFGMTVREYVFRLEEIMIRVLAAFGIKGFRQNGKPGVWIGPRDKIGSVGVRVSHWVTNHGFSLNINLQIDPTQFIVCCGIPDIRMKSLNDMVAHPVSMSEVKETTKQIFLEVMRKTDRKTFT